MCISKQTTETKGLKKAYLSFYKPQKVSYKHTQPFNGLFSRTTWVGRYQKDKPFWILLKQEMTGCQWHQPNHMQIVCTSLQTDKHGSTLSFHIFYRPDARPAAQPTASKHCRQTGDLIHVTRQLVSFNLIPLVPSMLIYIHVSGEHLGFLVITSINED